MLLQPKQRKFRKSRKGRIQRKLGKDMAQRGLNPGGFALKYGDQALISLSSARWKARQIEAGRRSIRSTMKRAGRLWIRPFPDIPVTEKPTDARMGKGKGNLSFWVARLQPGQILYEVAGVDEDLAFKALRAASRKFPFPCAVIGRPSLKD